MMPAHCSPICARLELLCRLHAGVVSLFFLCPQLKGGHKSGWSGWPRAIKFSPPHLITTWSCEWTIWGIEWVNVTIHRLVRLLRDPLSTCWPVCLINVPTTHLLNLTSHPAVYSLTTNISECLMAERMWHCLAACGRCVRSKSPLCFKTRRSLSGCRTAIEFPVLTVFVSNRRTKTQKSDYLLKKPRLPILLYILFQFTLNVDRSICCDVGLVCRLLHVC